MSTTTAPTDAYIDRLRGYAPIYRAVLVREDDTPFHGRKQITDPADLAAFYRLYFRDATREECHLALLDTANTVIGLVRLTTGALSASIVDARAVFQHALLANAAAVILVHNHPSGNPDPSKQDIAITRQIAQAGKLLGVPLHDHLIIPDEGYTSLAERGLIA